jgi:thiol-disulfide isomerase/thioredoxin
MFRRKAKPQKIHSLDEIEPLVESGKPVMINFTQVGCPACQVMDGIANELAREYGESAHIVKLDIGRVQGAIDAYRIRSTPTTVVIAPAPEKTSKKARKRAQSGAASDRRPTQRFRASGLIKKHQLERVLTSNGAVPGAK